MMWLLPVSVLAVLAVWWLVRVAKPADTAGRLTATPVLSRLEQGVYWRLVEALPGMAVLTKVQLSRMLKAESLASGRAVLDQIDGASADFVICSKDLRPHVVIELDDDAHLGMPQRRADADRRAALAAAGIRVVRFSVKGIADPALIRTAAIRSAVFGK